MTNLKEFLNGTKYQEMFNNLKDNELLSCLTNAYPTILEILRSLCLPTGRPTNAIRDIFLGIYSHAQLFWENTPKGHEANWTKRESGEVLTQFYPNFPLIYECAKFENECKNQDDQALEDLCEKSFPEHIKMSPGLFLLTCACANKTVYGYSFMTKNESPGMIFEIDQTCFSRDYKPTIVCF